jgi:hypothetical protein
MQRTEFFVKPDGRKYLEHLGVRGRIILKQILVCESVNYFHLDQERNQLKAVLNRAMK